MMRAKHISYYDLKKISATHWTRDHLESYKELHVAQCCRPLLFQTLFLKLYDYDKDSETQKFALLFEIRIQTSEMVVFTEIGVQLDNPSKPTKTL